MCTVLVRCEAIGEVFYLGNLASQSMQKVISSLLCCLLIGKSKPTKLKTNFSDYRVQAGPLVTYFKPYKYQKFNVPEMM